MFALVVGWLVIGVCCACWVVFVSVGLLCLLFGVWLCLVTVQWFVVVIVDGSLFVMWLRLCFVCLV